MSRMATNEYIGAKRRVYALVDRAKRMRILDDYVFQSFSKSPLALVEETERDPPSSLHNFGGDVVEGSFFRVVIGADIDDAARICGIGVRVVLIATLRECRGG